MLDRSGAGVIRVWFFAPLATSASGGRSWTAFDQVLATAKARNVRVIATLTDQWGACETTGYKYDSWYTSGYRTTYLPWISEVTAHYKANTEIAMWEIVNEPEMKTTSGTCGSATAFRAFAADASQRIRAADPNHLIGSGVIGGGQCGAAGDDYALLHAIPTIDVCSYHDYNHATQGMPGDQWNGLARRIAQCATLNKPIIVGELGIEVRELAQPTLSARADAFMAKVSASNTAGADGTLLWMLTEPPLPGTYDIGLTDPVVAPLATLSGRR